MNSDASEIKQTSLPKNKMFPDPSFSGPLAPQFSDTLEEICLSKCGYTARKHKIQCNNMISKQCSNISTSAERCTTLTHCVANVLSTRVVHCDLLHDPWRQPPCTILSRISPSLTPQKMLGLRVWATLLWWLGLYIGSRLQGSRTMIALPHIIAPS